MIPHLNRKKGCLLGLAIGDALGAPVEFKKRGSFEPVYGYQSGGKFSLSAGEWTDDTAMALCLAQSLIECKRFDAEDQLKKYVAWMEKGYMSCTGKAIGMGKIVMRSLIRYKRTGRPCTDICHERFSGNGSLMRLAPLCIYYANDLDKAVRYAALNSKTTHGSRIAVDACRFFSYMIVHIFSGCKKDELFSDQFMNKLLRYFQDSPLHTSLLPLMHRSYIPKHESQIESSGYVIHSLEAALWSFYHADTFKDAILKAVNLGDDADTIGAITGQVAGAYYGAESIPEQWIKKLCKSELLQETCGRLIHNK